MFTTDRLTACRTKIMSIPQFEEIVESNDQTEARSEHLEKLRELVGNVYPNKFARSSISGGVDTISAIQQFEGVTNIESEVAESKSTLNPGERPPADKKDAMNERLKALGTVRIAGRLTTPPRGNFVHLTDGINKLQIYCNKKGPLALIRNDADNSLDHENGWAAWQLIDHGDFVGVEGYLFVTNTGEVSVHVEKLQFLAKAMLPMPDKMHGIADAEIRQRQRYVDLIGSSLRVKTDDEIEEEKRTGIKHLTTREVFQTRAKVISSMRRYLEAHGYIEVETPMLTPKATGAAAKPFKTHHNALDIDLYARIAPELYLKRLVVGGFEKVYELNRNFRNEGISYKHNPEFTMLEFYCAYMDVTGMMDLCEKMLQESVQKATSGLTVDYEGNKIDFSNFKRLSMKEALLKYLPTKGSWTGQLPIDMSLMTRGEFKDGWLDNPDDIFYLGAFFGSFPDEGYFLPNQIYTNIAGRQGEDVSLAKENPQVAEEKTSEFTTVLRITYPNDSDETRAQRVIADIFGNFIEPFIVQPTFIVDYPKSISPLSKASPSDPSIAERFELFINGMEIANGFSELNDPKEQYERFKDQMSERERGDEEAMILDEDYIRALSYGMPPAAGIGIGIDRLVMLLTNKHSIRDVILFPHMRPERRKEEEEI
mgnify:CR=1 FL=1